MVATLPQLQWLDGKEVTKSERILATQVHVCVHVCVCVCVCLCVCVCVCVCVISDRYMYVLAALPTGQGENSCTAEGVPSKKGIYECSID